MTTTVYCGNAIRRILKVPGSHQMEAKIMTRIGDPRVLEKQVIVRSDRAGVIGCAEYELGVLLTDEFLKIDHGKWILSMAIKNIVAFCMGNWASLSDECCGSCDEEHVGVERNSGLAYLSNSARKMKSPFLPRMQ